MLTVLIVIGAIVSGVVIGIVIAAVACRENKRISRP